MEIELDPKLEERLKAFAEQRGWSGQEAFDYLVERCLAEPPQTQPSDDTDKAH